MTNALVPIMSRKTAAIAVCGRIAQLPAQESARDARLWMGTTFCASFTEARMRSSRPVGQLEHREHRERAGVERIPFEDRRTASAPRHVALDRRARDLVQLFVELVEQ